MPEKMYNYEKNVDKLYMTRYNPFHQIQQEKNKKERMKMKKLCVWALAAMMTVGATGAMADHLDDIKAKGKLVVGSEVSFAPI